jgi:hypothetical protein
VPKHEIAKRLKRSISAVQQRALMDGSSFAVRDRNQGSGQ